MSQPHSLNYIGDLDYSVVQQCMHCGMCLPSCPTYLETKKERNSPRGRIALMRSIADGELELGKEFAEEMYYCLGCLACTTACPAGVNYPKLFEYARAEIEHHDVFVSADRRFWRWLTLRQLFAKPKLLRLVGRLLWLYQASGLCALVRRSKILRLLPHNLRDLEPNTPIIQSKFSSQLIEKKESRSEQATHQVGMLTGCVQDLIFADINRDTVDVLVENGCEVHTPRNQGCCGSLHAHNGDLEQAKTQAKNLIDQFDLDNLSAVITNAAGCGSHLKHFHELLRDDPDYADRAAIWDQKVRDISEWLCEIDFRLPRSSAEEREPPRRVTYHEACHLCHGQGISQEPRKLLDSLPQTELVELKEATHCCGSAGIYNITQPEQAEKLQKQKVQHIQATEANIVATANPGCHLQIQNGLTNKEIKVQHPVSLLAQAYRDESISHSGSK